MKNFAQFGISKYAYTGGNIRPFCRDFSAVASTIAPTILTNSSEIIAHRFNCRFLHCCQRLSVCLFVSVFYFTSSDNKGRHTRHRFISISYKKAARSHTRTHIRPRPRVYSFEDFDRWNQPHNNRNNTNCATTMTVVTNGKHTFSDLCTVSSLRSQFSGLGYMSACVSSVLTPTQPRTHTHHYH